MSYSVGIVGATGAVGKEILGCLNNSSLDVSKLRIFGSERSAGTTKDAGKFGDIKVERFDVNAARECDVVFLAVSGDFSLEHARAICEGDDGAVVIDNSSAFRYDKDVPLVVPEINADKIGNKKLIANPNCTTAIGLMALWPLHKAFKLKRVIMSVSVLHFLNSMIYNIFIHHSKSSSFICISHDTDLSSSIRCWTRGNG
jgi:aspartate-semialdehyde dehydrogenase